MEKILLTAIDRALLHAKLTAQRLSIQRDEMVTQAASKERARANYLSALRKLADKKSFLPPNHSRYRPLNDASNRTNWYCGRSQSQSLPPIQHFA